MAIHVLALHQVLRLFLDRRFRLLSSRLSVPRQNQESGVLEHHSGAMAITLAVEHAGV